MLFTVDLAKKLGMTPVALRRILRSMPEYADGVHTNYSWENDDPMIERIRVFVKEGDRRGANRLEDQAADRLTKYLNQHLNPPYRAKVSSSLLYRITVGVDGRLSPNDPTKYLSPLRGQSAFEIDILVYNTKTKVPFVAIEVKLKKFGTHDVLTYSTKALRHKAIFPFLRYGFVVVHCTRINDKFFIHNVGFDFALAFSERPEGRAEFVDLVKRQIGIAERLASIGIHEKQQVRKFESCIKIET